MATSHAALTVELEPNQHVTAKASATPKPSQDLVLPIVALIAPLGVAARI